MSDREVKTRQTAEEVADGLGYLSASSARDDFYEGWHAALTSVIIPEGRFDVGDEAIATMDGQDHPGHIEFVPNGLSTCLILASDRVRPLPKTVELTTNEKILEVATAMLDKIDHVMGDSNAVAHNLVGIYIEISQDLANGKTIDQLCTEHGVSTTKELS